MTTGRHLIGGPLNRGTQEWRPPEWRTPGMAALRNGGPPKWRTPGIADPNPREVCIVTTVHYKFVTTAATILVRSYATAHRHHNVTPRGDSLGRTK